MSFLGLLLGAVIGLALGLPFFIRPAWALRASAIIDRAVQGNTYERVWLILVLAFSGGGVGLLIALLGG